MEAYFPIRTVAKVMDTSVSAVEDVLARGSFHPVIQGAETSLPVSEMCHMGGALHLVHTDELSRGEIDRILDRFIEPWAPLAQ